MTETMQQPHQSNNSNEAVEVLDTTVGISPPSSHTTADEILNVENDVNFEFMSSAEFITTAVATTTNNDSVVYPVRKGNRRKAASNWKGTFRKSNTSDDFPAYDPWVKFDGKYPVEYSCNKLPNANGNWKFAKTFINFDFEIAMTIGEDVQDNIRAFEWSVLDAIVTDMGIDRCTLDKQRISVGGGGGVGGNGNRRDLLDFEIDSTEPSTNLRHRRMKRLSAPTIINRVSSTPHDQAMQSCEWLRHDPSKTNCIPIRGTVTAGFRALSSDDATKEVHEYVQSVIKQAVNTNKNVKVSHIQDVMYTSDRIKANSGNGGISRASGGNGVGSGVVTAFISVSVLFVLITSIFYVRRSRNSEESEEEPVEGPGSPRVTTKGHPDVEPVVTAIGLDSGSSSILDEETPDTPDSAETPSEQEPPSESQSKVDVETEVPEPALTASLSDSSGSPLSSSGLFLDPADSLDENEAEHSLSESVQQLLSAVALPPPDLPPRPPVVPLQRKNSKNLKKRRKKKKKKKQKTVLKRVNSRENVKAMEAIPESDNEGSEFGSEYSYGDSEHSTDDESSGLGSRQSSGCNTPVKGESMTSLSKKQLSPQDELFPSDVFAEVEYEFDIQAPDLLADNQDQGTLHPKSRLPFEMEIAKEKKTQSGGGNKIRPLPAPWV